RDAGHYRAELDQTRQIRRLRRRGPGAAHCFHLKRAATERLRGPSAFRGPKLKRSNSAVIDDRQSTRPQGAADAARPRRRGDRIRGREFISLFGGMAAAWSLAAQAQESATMGGTKATTAVLPQMEVARVKPVDTMPPNLRLSDTLIDLTEDFSLSSAHSLQDTTPELSPNLVD